MQNVWLDRNDEHIRDYILLMLGAPVINVELDKQQLDLSIRVARQVIKAYEEMPENQRPAPLPMEMYMVLVQQGSLAYAQLMLGNIRSKYLVPEIEKGVLVLIDRAKEDIEDFKARLEWVFDFPSSD